MIFFHGGGFSDCKAEDEAADNLEIMAQEFAKRGYVFLLVEYRKGRYKSPNKSYRSVQQVLAEYRALQDARGAIRSIIKHQKVRDQGINFLTEPYQIDPNNIFIGGNSARSIMAIQTAYYDATQIALVFPTPPSYPTIAQALGPIDNNNYYGKVTDAPDLRINIKGVMDLWGQAAFPLSFDGHLADFWKDNPNIPPMIAFHGANDMVLNPGRVGLIFAPPNLPNPNNINFNSESNCITSGLPNPFTLDSDGSMLDILGAGSRTIYDIFHNTDINQHIELYISCNMGHGVDNPTNFGLTSSTIADVYRYIVQRATTYFQVVITNQLSNLTDKRDLFYDCVNSRVKSYNPPGTPPGNSVFNNNPASCALSKCPSN